MLDYQEWLPVSIALYEDRIEVKPVEREKADEGQSHSEKNLSASAKDRSEGEQQTDSSNKVREDL